jgi:hypothetical protein
MLPHARHRLISVKRNHVCRLETPGYKVTLEPPPDSPQPVPGSAHPTAEPPVPFTRPRLIFRLGCKIEFLVAVEVVAA